MSGWTCPSCGSESVVSVREFVAVYDWRRIATGNAHRICTRLEEYGWQPKASEGRGDVVRRWLRDDRHESGRRPAPQYLCAACARAWHAREVP